MNWKSPSWGRGAGQEAPQCLKEVFSATYGSKNFRDMERKVGDNATATLPL